jgi:hypothetical protein
MLNDTQAEASPDSPLYFELDSITIDYELPRVPGIADTPEDYSQEIGGRIFVLGPGDDKEDERVEIGHLRATLIQLERAMQDGIELWDILDAPSEETAECLQLFDNVDDVKLRVDDEEFSRRVRNLFDADVWFGDILLVEKIEIKPEYRGYGVGLVAMRGLIEAFGRSCSLVVCKPLPLQYSGNVNEENRFDFKAAQEKLRKYWAKAGFKRVPKTDLYALTPLHKLPDLPKSTIQPSAPKRLNWMR